MKRTKAQLIDEIAELKRMLQEAQEIAPQAGHIEVETAEREPGAAGGAQDQAGEGETRETGQGGAAGESTGGALAAAGSETREAVAESGDGVAELLAVSEEDAEEERGDQAAVEVGREEEGALAARGSESREAAAERAFAALSDPKKERLLRHYVNSGGQVTKAARLAGVASRTHYHWMANDPLYAAAFEAAKLRTLDIIEAEIIRRGVKGYKEPIIYQGQVTGYVRRYSDNLLMFLAKRRDPLYRDNPQLALGLKAAGDIKISLSIPRPDEPAAIDAEAREVPDRATQPVDNTPAR